MNFQYFQLLPINPYSLFNISQPRGKLNNVIYNFPSTQITTIYRLYLICFIILR